MALSFAASAVSSFTGTTSRTCAFNTYSVVAGDLVLVAVITSSLNNVSSVTGLGATWTKLRSSLISGGSPTCELEIWAGQNCSAGNTVTVNLTSSDSISIDMFAITSSTAGASTVSASAIAATAGSSFSAPSQSASAGQLVFDVIIANDPFASGAASVTDSPGAFTTVDTLQTSNSFTNIYFLSAYRVATGSETASRTWNNFGAPTVENGVQASVLVAPPPPAVTPRKPVVVTRQSLVSASVR